MTSLPNSVTSITGEKLYTVSAGGAADLRDSLRKAIPPPERAPASTRGRVASQDDFSRLMSASEVRLSSVPTTTTPPVIVSRVMGSGAWQFAVSFSPDYRTCSVSVTYGKNGPTFRWKGLDGSTYEAKTIAASGARCSIGEGNPFAG